MNKNILFLSVFALAFVASANLMAMELTQEDQETLNNIPIQDIRNYIKEEDFKDMDRYYYEELNLAINDLLSAHAQAMTGNKKAKGILNTESLPLGQDTPSALQKLEAARFGIISAPRNPDVTYCIAEIPAKHIKPVFNIKKTLIQMAFGAVTVGGGYLVKNYIVNKYFGSN